MGRHHARRTITPHAVLGTLAVLAVTGGTISAYVHVSPRPPAVGSDSLPVLTTLAPAASGGQVSTRTASPRPATVRTPRTHPAVAPSATGWVRSHPRTASPWTPRVTHVWRAPVAATTAPRPRRTVAPKSSPVAAPARTSRPTPTRACEEWWQK
jgi:hypothetical protein